MSRRRRNAISNRDSQLVVAVAGAGAIGAMFAGCQPTGAAIPDAVLTGGFALFVIWAAASAPWWAIVGSAGTAAVFAVGQPLLVIYALAAVAVGAWLGATRNSLPAARSVAAAVTLHVVLRLEWDVGFLSSGLVAATVTGLLIGAGVARRPASVRRRVMRRAIGIGGFVLVALIGMGISVGMAKSNANRGYDALLEGLAQVRDGDPVQAASSLRRAADELRHADAKWTALWSQPARLVPVLAQNRSALGDVLGRAADAADAAAAALGLIDLDQLRIVGGVIDVDALALLGGPLGDLERTASDLAVALDAADTPWLLVPFHDRLERAQELATTVAREAHTSSAVARLGPAMLGVDGQRRYLVAFTSPAEARGTSGLMGNWAEITVDRGALELTRTGRTSVLVDGIRAAGARIDAPADYLARYAIFGAGSPTGGVDPKFWSNVTMSPDMPSVGSAMAQLYEQATGRVVDGVIVIDPAGLSALLELTGPVSVPSADVRLSAADVEQYLLVDQYERAESEREDVLEAVTEATIARVLRVPLPGPQVLARALGSAATEGHISIWAARPDEQVLMQLTGTDAALPALRGGDGIAVVNDNASGNKIDTFLERSVSYRARVDERSGRIDATMTITLQNHAPTTGYPDYVIGNLLELPSGTNRTLLSVFTPLGFTAATLDGQPIGLTAGTESGWQVYSTFVVLAPGQARTLVVTLQGVVDRGHYELVYRPQALARPGLLSVEVTNQNSDTVAGFVGTLERRSVLSSSGLAPWMPAIAGSEGV